MNKRHFTKRKFTLSNLMSLSPKKTKLSIIAACAFIIIGVGAYYTIKTRNDNLAQASLVQKKLQQVKASGKKLHNETNDTKKLKYLQALEDKYQAYKKQNDASAHVLHQYRTEIQEGKDYFKKETKGIISDNTTQDINKETTDTLKSKLTNLKSELKDVKSYKGIAFTAKETKKYTTKINKMIKKYDSKNNELAAAASSSSVAAAQSSSIALAQSSANNSTSGNSTSSYSGSTGNSTGSGSQTTSKTYTPSSNTTSTHTNNSYSSTKSYSATKSSTPTTSSTTSNSSGGKRVGYEYDHNGNQVGITVDSSGGGTDYTNDGSYAGGFTVN